MTNLITSNESSTEQTIAAQPPSRVLVGLMSGTSLDGISAAVVRFTEDESRITAQLLAFEQRAYTTAQRIALKRPMTGDSAQAYCQLNVDLGHWLADAALSALADSSVARRDVAAIASHGHTMWHEPGHSTWQLGDAAVIAERTQCAVVSDFRARDVAAGGQGAPLVSMADATLFAHDKHWRALQNIGGISNVTVVPPANTINAIDGVRAFDTGPGVVLIDAIAHKIDASLPYDIDGALALTGTRNAEVVREFLVLPYFAEEPPKSTGRERFNAAFVEHFWSACMAHGCSPVDALATAVALTAETIADQYRRFLPEPIREVVISGGGARNPALVRAIVEAVAPLPVQQFSALYFDGDAKEAVAFALLGYLHLSGRPGNVPRATGARASRQLGVLTPA